MMKFTKIILGITLGTVVFIGSLIVYSVGGNFNPNYEITEKYLKTIPENPVVYTGTSNVVISTSAQYSDADLGIVCGQKVIKLGCLLDVSSFEELHSITKGDYTIKHMIAPSKQYEVVVAANTTELNSATLWYVTAIRSTSPNVSLTRGIQIGQKVSSIKKKYGIKIKESKPLQIEDCEIKFSTDSGLLTEVFMHV